MNGWTPIDPEDAESRPFSACVSWKPTDSEEHDPSWSWVSAMSGVLYFDAPGGSPRIEMLHGLIASTPLEAAWVRRPGVYTETLTFERVALDAKPLADRPGVAFNGLDADTAHLTLSNRDAASPFQKISITIGADGFAAGHIIIPNEEIIAQGFIDPTPTGRLQSIALSTLVRLDGRRSTALGGFIDIKKGTARLQVFEANAVPYQSKYTAVTVGQETFSVSIGK